MGSSCACAVLSVRITLGNKQPQYVIREVRDPNSVSLDAVVQLFTALTRGAIFVRRCS